MNRFKPTAPSFLIMLVFACFVFLPQMQALPPEIPGNPDGCYPAFTTAEGCNALALLGSGLGNTGVGWYSLFLAGNANFNTGVGAGALALTSTGADSNTAVGTGAMLLNTSGFENVAIGTDALLYNDSGSDNNAVGAFALFNNTTGTNNTANGAFALFSNTEGNLNTANGLSALFFNTTGGGNTAVGGDALVLNDSGGRNTAIGTGALSQNTIGSNNIAVGGSAGQNLTTGDHNIDIGNHGVAGESDTIRIGDMFHISTFIAGIVGSGPFSCSVTIDPVTGQLGVGGCISSKRFKKDIDPMGKSSEVIFSLKPVTFHYKNDKTNMPQFGLVAEEVAKVNPDLIAVDKEGKPYSVRYEHINAMLLNEFLKEHHKVQNQERRIQEQEATIAQLKKEMETVVTRLKEQDSRIQRVSDQVEMNKAAPQLVASD